MEYVKGFVVTVKNDDNVSMTTGADNIARTTVAKVLDSAPIMVSAISLKTKLVMITFTLFVIIFYKSPRRIEAFRSFVHGGCRL